MKRERGRLAAIMIAMNMNISLYFIFIPSLPKLSKRVVPLSGPRKIDSGILVFRTDECDLFHDSKASKVSSFFIGAYSPANQRGNQGRQSFSYPE